MTIPSVEFYAGINEEIINVSLRRNKTTGIRKVVLFFSRMKAIEKFKSFTRKSYGDLRLTDEEGQITVTPSSMKFIFKGEEGDETQRVECGFEIEQDSDWERFMRFMNRYAQANGMVYKDR
jgi:photosystem II Psb28-2 protein